jgi:hypothetical protein
MSLNWPRIGGWICFHRTTPARLAVTMFSTRGPGNMFLQLCHSI